MNQEIAISKIITEIKERHLISGYAIPDIEYYLTLAFAIGFDEGKLVKYKKKKVVQMDLKGNVLHIFESTNKAAIKLNVHVSSVRNAINGHKESLHGYIWRYIE